MTGSLNKTNYQLTGKTGGWYEELTAKGALNAIKYEYYNGNNEWNFFAYKFETGTLTNVFSKKSFSAIDVKFGFQRNSPYYTMTLIIPIIALTMLAPLGLIIPGKTVLKYVTQLDVKLDSPAHIACFTL